MPEAPLRHDAPAHNSVPELTEIRRRLNAPRHPDGHARPTTADAAAPSGAVSSPGMTARGTATSQVWPGRAQGLTSTPPALPHDGKRLHPPATAAPWPSPSGPSSRQEHPPVTTTHSGVATATRATAAAARATDLSQGLRPGRDPGRRPGRGLRRVPAGRVHRDHGPVRVRQVDADALHGRPGHGLRRLGPHRRHRADRAEGQEAHPAAPGQDRLHLPGVQPAADADRPGEHHPARWTSPAASPTSEWLDRVIETVGLSDRLKHRPAQLSGGQQQRVAVARALASRPEIIFADEPTGNLDSRSGAEVLGFLRNSVRELGQTVVMVTHDPVAASYADRVVFLADGRIVDEHATARPPSRCWTGCGTSTPRAAPADRRPRRPGAARPDQPAATAHSATTSSRTEPPCSVPPCAMCFAHKARLLMTVLAVMLGVAFVSGTLVFTDTISDAYQKSSAKSFNDVDVAVSRQVAPTGPGDPAPRTPRLDASDCSTPRPRCPAPPPPPAPSTASPPSPTRTAS